MGQRLGKMTDKYRHATWKDVMDEPFPEIKEVTAEMQIAAFKQRRFMRGSVRLTLGRLRTSGEIEERRQQALNNPLL